MRHTGTFESISMALATRARLYNLLAFIIQYDTINRSISRVSLKCVVHARHHRVAMDVMRFDRMFIAAMKKET